MKTNWKLKEYNAGLQNNSIRSSSHNTRLTTLVIQNEQHKITKYRTFHTSHVHVVSISVISYRTLIIHGLINTI